MITFGILLINGKNIPEPARPNASEINWLAQYNKPQQNVLILGSAPEYRDLCPEKGANVTVVDFDENTYKSLAKDQTYFYLLSK